MKDRLRNIILDLVFSAKSGHIASSFSCIDIIDVIYEFFKDDKTYFVLSKGHAAPALYAKLYTMNYINEDEMRKFRNGGILTGHPNIDIPGVDVGVGSLGQGISIGVGLSIMRNKRTFVLLGDGELNEGQVWEAIMYAGQLCLNNITFIIDKNNFQLDSSTMEIIDLNDIKSKIMSFNIDCFEIDGHDKCEIYKGLNKKSKKPICLIANTVKGKGVSYMENNNVWHSFPKHLKNLDQLYILAKKELGDTKCEKEW